MTRRALASQHGFTILEVLAAMIVLAVGVLGTLGLLNVSARAAASARAQEAGTSLARELIEGARSVTYAKLQPTSIDGEIQALPGLADAGAGPGWTIVRRGITFTVRTSECIFDDPSDGGGPHGASFCSDGAAAGTADKVPEDYKRVRVDIDWTSRGVAHNVHQSELINNNGSAGAPAVRTLTLSSPLLVNNQVTSGTTVRFALTTSSAPVTTQWLLDGTAQGPITNGSGLAWTFDWNVGTAGTANSVVDGTYVVSAQAFDTYGQSGPTKSNTVTLNRLAPTKVAGLVGGRTADPSDPTRQAVDLEWLPNPERDITGYSVDRTDSSGTNRVTVCPRALKTSCIDTSPPNQDNLKYYVQAWDTDPAGQPRSGDFSDPLTVVLGNTPPNPPASVTAITNADGSATLTWVAPSPGDTDPGDSIAFYRIYRDGKTFADRYATWSGPGSALTFVDANTNDVQHDYWITAVDEHYAESVVVGPVSA
ncbi:prepilin-type N-terminal cleavage/methylation domain-containing protein [Candidatus Solirubrobacter pratensis]|uniref:prepilin-type N-terminal cleavage/methylation domain-containing protein n=1 Tax=Candidatus Solirubrobacter pratensis TaxID=1298857 RepID=UPI000409B58C|nr:prepilin-type N-terminal cleavage/methylation domain-containing protein [Candidatus Solirubrobacter pratensis]